jgi:hypothetical protein
VKNQRKMTKIALMFITLHPRSLLISILKHDRLPNNRAQIKPSLPRSTKSPSLISDLKCMIPLTNNYSSYIFSDDGGYTFLQYACDMGYDEIVDYLLGKECNAMLSE